MSQTASAAHGHIRFPRAPLLGLPTDNGEQVDRDAIRPRLGMARFGEGRIYSE